MRYPNFYFSVFNFGNYLKAVEELITLPIPWTIQRIIGILIVAVFYPIYEILLHISFALDDILFGDYKNIKLEKPIFMVGNARSGTTFGHRLMIADEKLTSLKAWEVLCPSICAYQIVLFFWYLDQYIFFNQLERLLNYIQDRAMHGLDSIHHGRLSIAEEDEPVLIHIWASTFIRFIAPVECTKRWFYFDNEDIDNRIVWMEYYKEIAQRHMYKLPNHGKGYTFLSKNPGFTFKVASLPLVFPDMRLVYLVRNPLDATASALLLFSSIIKQAPGLEGAHLNQTIKAKFTPLLEWYTKSYSHALNVIDLNYRKIPHVIVKYEDLVFTPTQTMLNIYKTFNMDVPPKLKQTWLNEEERAKTFKPEEFQRITAFGFSEAAMIKELEPVFKRFNFPYEPEDAGRPSSEQSTSRKFISVASVESRRSRTQY